MMMISKSTRKYISRASWEEYDAMVAEKRDRMRTNEKRDKSEGYEILEKTPHGWFHNVKSFD